jgi:hypothetical protein
MAIDPSTAKALATVATKVVTDSETRKKVLLIILPCDRPSLADCYDFADSYYALCHAGRGF